MIKDEIAVIRHEVERLRQILGAKLKEITDLEASCLHVWTEPRLIVQKVQYDCGSYGGDYNSRKWERECVSCGKIDTTYREALQRVPDFGDQRGKITLSNLGG